VGRLLCHLDGVGGRGQLVQRLDGAVGQARQHVEQVFADGYAESAAALHDAKDGGYLGSSVLASEMQPVAPSDRNRAHRILGPVRR